MRVSIYGILPYVSLSSCYLTVIILLFASSLQVLFSCFFRISLESRLGLGVNGFCCITVAFAKHLSGYLVVINPVPYGLNETGWSIRDGGRPERMISWTIEQIGRIMR
ncbi:hypothetical protein QCA50_008791 [Cerrena zonata]|uniref:Uncharacterized protein n=1 Tax=Cerrena zonata TaxID=2478898 RepID=A0AAW0G3Z5_9APHY